MFKQDSETNLGKIFENEELIERPQISFSFSSERKYISTYIIC